MDWQRLIAGRLFQTGLVAAGLAMAIHLDWHLARHHGRWSAGWAHHWVVALPLFAAAAWILVRRWPDRIVPASLATLGAAAVLGQVVEPLMESLAFGAPIAQGFGAERLHAFFQFFGAGLLAYVVAAWWLARRARADATAGPDA